MRVEPALRSAISGACRASTPISPAAPGTITLSTSSSKTAPSGVVSEIENLRAPSATSAPSSDTYRFLARDHAAPESTLALAKAASLGRERVRPLAWCSRPRNSAASLDGAQAVTLVGEGLQQTRRDLFPAPVPFNGPARGLPQGLAVILRELEQLPELGRQILGIAGLEARQPTLLGRVFGFEALRDLREAGVPGDERERSGGGGFGRDHPERLGKDRRHDSDLAERKQVHEMPVLQWS